MNLYIVVACISLFLAFLSFAWICLSFIPEIEEVFRRIREWFLK